MSELKSRVVSVLGDALTHIAAPYEMKRPSTPEGKTWSLLADRETSASWGYKIWEAVPYDECPRCNQFEFRPVTSVEIHGLAETVDHERMCKNCKYTEAESSKST